MRCYEAASDREERNDEIETEKAMQVIEVTQPGVDAEARWVKKGENSVFGYKQHTLVDNFGMIASMNRNANCYDHAPMESFWGLLKTERAHHRRFKTR